MINLISNAVKYNEKEQVKIQFGVRDNVDVYEFHVKDNGPGTSKKNQVKIFQIFQTLGGKVTHSYFPIIVPKGLI